MMRKATALVGFAAITAAVGFKLAEDPDYKAAQNLMREKPALVLHPDSIAQEVFAGKLTYQQEPVEAKNTATTADSVFSFAQKLMGHQYKFGGNKPGGFDCSGFTNYVYSRFGFDVPHGSVNQAGVGRAIAKEKARRGDLLIFTGTNVSVREPGHTGIVISGKNEPIRFIHASSNGGVKVSEVEGTRYADRLLQVRRIF